MAKLVCVNGYNKGDQFVLGEGENIVGRSPDCDVVLFDKRVSRHHCRIIRHGSSQFVEDCGSSHGTYVNGRNIDGRTVLKEGDKLKIGQTNLVVSGKGLGNKLDEEVAEAENDLTGHGFHRLLEKTEVQVVANHTPLIDNERTKFGFIKTLFGKKH